MPLHYAMDYDVFFPLLCTPLDFFFALKSLYIFLYFATSLCRCVVHFLISAPFYHRTTLLLCIFICAFDLILHFFLCFTHLLFEYMYIVQVYIFNLKFKYRRYSFAVVWERSCVLHLLLTARSKMFERLCHRLGENASKRHSMEKQIERKRSAAAVMQ